MSEQWDKPISHHYEEACRQTSKPSQQQVASQHPVIKECGTTVNTLLLARILAESHGSLRIHETDWKDFHTAFEKHACSCVCVCVNVHFQNLKLTKRIWKEDRRRDPSGGMSFWDERMSSSFQLCASPLCQSTSPTGKLNQSLRHASIIGLSRITLCMPFFPRHT